LLAVVVVAQVHILTQDLVLAVVDLE